MLIPSEKEIIEILDDAKEIFKKEPNYLVLKDNKPIVFVGDTHGDFKTTEEIIQRFFEAHRLVFLGDYVDRATSELGSVKNITYLLRLKTEKPEDLIMLRGNHEFRDVFMWHGFSYELQKANLENLQEPFEDVFSQLPYTAVTESGLIALHGGLPNISSLDELKNLPKGVTDDYDNRVISHIVWNDNVHKDLSPKGFQPNIMRGCSDEHVLMYDESFFNEKMNIIGKNVLVRSHDYYAKGLSFHDRLLTLFSSRKYAKKGPLKGVFVAIMDNPKKEIKTAKELRIEHI